MNQNPDLTVISRIVSARVNTRNAFIPGSIVLIAAIIGILLTALVVARGGTQNHGSDAGDPDAQIRYVSENWSRITFSAWDRWRSALF